MHVKILTDIGFTKNSPAVVAISYVQGYMLHACCYPEYATDEGVRVKKAKFATRVGHLVHNASPFITHEQSRVHR